MSVWAVRNLSAGTTHFQLPEGATKRDAERAVGELRGQRILHLGEEVVWGLERQEAHEEPEVREKRMEAVEKEAAKHEAAAKRKKKAG